MSDASRYLLVVMAQCCKLFVKVTRIRVSLYHAVKRTQPSVVCFAMVFRAHPDQREVVAALQ